MDPNDPIAQSIDYEYEQGLQDPSRAQTILKMLPRLVTARPEMRNIQATSGLPQTGQEALADVGAIAGQAPSGIGTDVRMGTNLGDIYQKRAGQRIGADLGANQQELERTRQANVMNIAENTQAQGAMDWVQRDRELAQKIKAESRLLNVDARRRLEFLFGDAAKAVGPPDSPAYQAYTQRLMQAMRDPEKRQALLDASTGMQTMVGLMDEALAAATGGGQQMPVPSSRAEAALGVTGRMAGVPDTAPTGQAAWNVAPGEQASRDVRAGQIVAGEKTALPGQDPAAAAAAAVLQPTPPRPFREQDSREGTSAYQTKKQAHDVAEQSRHRAEQQLAISQTEAARGVRNDAQKQALERQETMALYKATMTSLDEAIANAKRLKTHKGLDNVTGGLFGLNARTVNLTGEARAAQSLLDTVMAKGFLDSLMNMKSASKTGASGFGQLSEKEGAIIRASIGSLDPRQDTRDFKEMLEDYIQKLDGWRARAVETYRSSPYSGGRTEAPEPGGARTLPGAGGEISIGAMPR